MGPAGLGVPGVSQEACSLQGCRGGVFDEIKARGSRREGPVRALSLGRTELRERGGAWRHRVPVALGSGPCEAETYR